MYRRISSCIIINKDAITIIDIEGWWEIYRVSKDQSVSMTISNNKRGEWENRCIAVMLLVVKYLTRAIDFIVNRISIFEHRMDTSFLVMSESKMCIRAFFLSRVQKPFALRPFNANSWRNSFDEIIVVTKERFIFSLSSWIHERGVMLAKSNRKHPIIDASFCSWRIIKQIVAMQQRFLSRTKIRQ